MEISNDPYRPLNSWKKRGLNIDICEINRTFKYKKPKLSNIALEDTLIEGERYGVCSKKGRFRKDMEDTYEVALEIHNCSFRHAFAIFDGHSGTEASLFGSKNLINNIESIDEQGIIQAFELTDYLFCNDNQKKGGTTVALSILNYTHLITANIGDTKIILIKENSFQILSYDHVASDISEQSRIEMAGGYVINHNKTLRVSGQLAITRSIGDAKFKDYLISIPYFQSTKLTIDDLALVIASDGLFETLTPAEVFKIVKEKVRHKPSEIAQVLTSEAIDAGSKDNVTVIVVKLQEFYTLASSQTNRNKQKTFNF
jgi:serine/threonine protein phosphatase PrpC